MPAPYTATVLAALRAELEQEGRLPLGQDPYPVIANVLGISREEAEEAYEGSGIDAWSDPQLLARGGDDFLEGLAPSQDPLLRRAGATR